MKFILDDGFGLKTYHLTDVTKGNKVKRKFAFMPIHAVQHHQIRWLEFVTVEYAYLNSMIWGGFRWRPIRFIDKN